MSTRFMMTARPWAVTTAALLLAGLTSNSMAQNANAPNRLESGETHTLTTRQTSWPIQISYFAPKKDEDAPETATKEAPVVILLHDKNGSRRVFRPLANKLNNLGFAVVTVDLRKHGESKGEKPNTGDGDSGKPSNRRNARADLRPDDYKRMIDDDLEAVKGFLMEEHHRGHLNIRKTGIVAVGMSAPIALLYAQLDWLKKPYPDASQLAARTPKGQDVRAVVLISPDASLPGVSTNSATRFLRNPELGLAVRMIYGAKDTKTARDAERLFKTLSGIKGNEERMTQLKHPSQLHGVELLGQRLGKGTVDAYIMSFCNKFLNELEDPWRNRKSRLQ